MKVISKIRNFKVLCVTKRGEGPFNVRKHLRIRGDAALLQETENMADLSIPVRVFVFFRNQNFPFITLTKGLNGRVVVIKVEAPDGSVWELYSDIVTEKGKLQGIGKIPSSSDYRPHKN